MPDPGRGGAALSWLLCNFPKFSSSSARTHSGNSSDSVSIGKLKTYQLYEGFKASAHLHKLNVESLRKGAPRLWARIGAGDEDFAKDLGQAVLVSHLDMITAVLDFLGIPHENGFFAKDMDAKAASHRGLEGPRLRKIPTRPIPSPYCSSISIT